MKAKFKSLVNAAIVAFGLDVLHNKKLNCPHCGATQAVKSGQERHICQHCTRHFVESDAVKEYHEAVKQHCLKLYTNGMDILSIEQATGVNQNILLNWVNFAATPSSLVLEPNSKVCDLQAFAKAKNASIETEVAANKPLHVL